jgi:hypothetical protein
MALSKCSVVSCIEGGVDLISSGRSLVADQYLPSGDVLEVILLLLGVSIFSYCSVGACCIRIQSYTVPTELNPVLFIDGADLDPKSRNKF